MYEEGNDGRPHELIPLLHLADRQDTYDPHEVAKMTIFTVVDLETTPSAGALAAALDEKFPGRHYKLACNAWLVADAATASEVSNRLGMSQEGGRMGIVTEVGGYFGRANPEIWTWIKTNWEGLPRG